MLNCAAMLLAGAMVVGQAGEEAANKVPPSHQKHLKPLQHFIGDWELVGEIQLAGQPKVEFVFHRRLGWTMQNNFIETVITQIVDGKTEIRHKSMIGWDAKAEQITESGFWSSNLPIKDPAWTEVVTWAPKDETWLIRREGVSGVYTIIDEDMHKYECKFGGDDGSENSWHFTAKRVK